MKDSLDYLRTTVKNIILERLNVIKNQDYVSALKLAFKPIAVNLEYLFFEISFTIGFNLN
jgi:hypothetical protein